MSESKSKQNSCPKRRRSETQINNNFMRPPIAIAPKTNLPKNIQNVEILSTIKTEPAGFLTIIPANSRSATNHQILSEIDTIERNKRSAISLKTDEYTEIHFESLTNNAVLQNTAKRIKIGNNTADADDNIIPMQYIILQNQNIADNFNTIVIADNNDEKMSNQQLEYKIIKNNVSNNGIMQQFNIVDKSNSSNSNCSNTSLGILPKLNFNNHHQEEMNNSVVTQTNSEKKNHFINLIQKNETNNAIESSHSSIPLLQKCNIMNNECKPAIISINNLKTDNKSSSGSLNIVSIENFESLNNSLKCMSSRSQKPVVIMQQQLSPPNRTEISSLRAKRILPISANGLNKLSPIDITQGVNIESKILSDQIIISSPLKSNENFYHSKIIGNNNNTNSSMRANNDDNEQETDHFLLKKEFPVISSSQVDSVLKAIDMQGINRGIIANEINNYSKKDTGNKETNDKVHSLSSVQGTAGGLCKNENTLSSNTSIDPSIKIQETNRSVKRFQSSEKQTDNYFKIAEKFPVDSLLQFFKCKECSYMSLNEKHIFEHMGREHVNVSHSKGKPMNLKCPGCSNTFHHEASLLSHIVHDHQVHESEARIMAHRLSLRENLTSDNNSKKQLVTQTHNTTIQNEESIVNQRTDDPLIENNERSEILSTLTLPKINSVCLVQPNSLPPENNVMGEIATLEYIQSINNMPVIIEQSSLQKRVDINPFLNDNDADKYPGKLDVKENELVENKNIDCLEKPNLFELKNVVGEQRNFEFVNFKNVANSDGDGYLQEDDTIERGIISDSEIEFNDLNSVKKSAKENEKSETIKETVIKIKKKGRPKGSKSYATKPQLISFKQGYKCEVEDCVVRMLVQENISYHQKCHVISPTTTATQQRNFNFQCPECVEFKTNNWNNLAGHLWRSHIIDMELHSCDLCSYKTPSFSHLTNQHRGIHGDDRPFVCDDCGKGFKTTKQLRNHRALHNAKTKEPLKCDECKRDFTNTRLLKLHKDSVHKESKPFTCSSCPYSAATRSALKLHLRRHTGEKPFSCEQCSYSTGDHNSLRRHKLRHLGLKPYSCPHCNYACIQSSTYKVHLKNKHPGLDHDLMFSCQYCSYKSIKKDNLLTHMAKHEQISASNKIQTNSGSLQILGE